MASNRLAICTYLFVVVIISKIQTDIITTGTEDLVDAYYTSTPTITDKFTPQDDKDAQDIVNSNRKEEIIAGIFMYRDKMRRYAIHKRILTKIVPVTGVSYKGGSSHTRYWINDYYPPQRTGNWTDTFLDLCFGLMEDEYLVLDNYLINFFDSEDETWIIIGMILIKDMQHMITSHDHRYGRGERFKDNRKAQRHPFENMLRVWVRHNREPIETEKLNQESVAKDAKDLGTEYGDGGWHENRDKIELILMKKSIIYARAVIQEFEKANGGKPMEDIINDCKKSHDLNHDLADTYASLALYIKNKYAYIAGILRKYCDGSDQWAAWIMCIAVIHPQEWPKVDQAFQKDPAGDSLSKFILQKMANDKVMAEMIAMVVDPKYKPTSFIGSPAPGSTPPPVTPTTIAPSHPPTGSF